MPRSGLQLRFSVLTGPWLEAAVATAYMERWVAWFCQVTQGIAKVTASRLQYPQMLYKMTAKEMCYSCPGRGEERL
ncbi:hypothetical protein C8J56DRAFT_981632 [Mycena floridula]|nr:hypothetical protein C8J56DRAFT_981632 [Mycena floridula]